MRRPCLSSGLGTKLASNGNLRSVTQVQDSKIRSKDNYKGLSKVVIQLFTSTKFVTTIFMFITAISFWIYNSTVYDEGKTVILQLYPRFGNASFEDIFIQEVEHNYHPRTLLYTEKPPMWMVKSFYSFFYIELNIAGKPYHMTIDSGSTLSWVNCKIGDLGPSPDYLGKLNEPYTPDGDKLVSKDKDICTMIADWYDEDSQIVHDDFECCSFYIKYGDSSFAKGIWVEDTIKYKTFFEKTTYQSFKAYFGCTYEFESKYLDSKMDGILGLQHLQDISLASQFTTKIGLPNIFGHCIFIKESDPTSGYLILGWYHSLAMSAGIEWVPMKEPANFRQRLLEMHKLFYGKDEVQVQIGNIALDTGSVQTYMIENVYNPLNTMVTNHARNLGYVQDDILDSEGFKQTCWKVKQKFSPNAFNKITFRFERDVDLKISPNKFIRRKNKDHYCFGLIIENLPFEESIPPKDEDSIAFEEEKTTSSEEEVFTNIIASLGGIWLTNNLIVYDNEELRIGFKESDCELGDKKRQRGPADPGPSE